MNHIPLELDRRQFGDPILRAQPKPILVSKIRSTDIQELVQDMFYTLKNLQLGVGLAAPQIGRSLQLVVVCIQKTVHRPHVEPFEVVLVHPKLTGKVTGPISEKWEGCISSGAGQAGIFAKVPRHEKVEVEYYTEKAKKVRQIFLGLQAQVVQHEIDHLNGVLFVDRVKDTQTYMTAQEYEKRIRAKAKQERIV